MDIPINRIATSVAALSAQRTPPGRPQGPRELLQTPGSPNTLENRPEDAPGRIPVPALNPELDDTVSLINDQEKAKRESMDYQILEKVVKRKNDNDEKKIDNKESKNALGKERSEELRTDNTSTPTNSDVNQQPESRLTVAEFNIEQRRMELRVESRSEPSPAKSDPLVLDLNDDGIQTSGIDSGVRFDINADGIYERVSVARGDDAFLALDKNRNGIIDDGSELFGDQNGAANGFAELARYDDNNDGMINQNDRIYADLSLLRFGSMDQQSLLSLEQSGIESINLNFSNTDQALNEYDGITQLGEFERTDGSKGTAADLMLGYRTLA